MTHPLALTGERTVPGVPEEGYWFARHEAAYRWIAARLPRLAPGGVVVDAGAGEGYGVALLAGAGAGLAVAADYDDATSAHVRATYPQVAVLRCNLAALPLRPGSADLLVSLQVVEHLWDLPGFLATCRAAVRPGGTVVVTTPNRLTFSPGLPRGAKPTNPFHVAEFDAAEVRHLLREAGLDGIEVRGLRHGPRLAAWERDHGSLVAAQVAAVLSGTWPADLRSFVPTVAWSDFVIDADPQAADLAGCLDLVATAEVPA